MSNKIYSEERTDWLGNKYTVHKDQNGNIIGTSEERESLFGGKYIQHKDKNGNNIGTSEERESFFGGKYTQHMDNSGKYIGTSEQRESFFGGSYTQHDFNNSSSAPFTPSSTNSGSYSSSYSDNYSGSYSSSPPIPKAPEFEIDLTANIPEMIVSMCILAFIMLFTVQNLAAHIHDILNYKWYISAVIFTLSTVFLLFKYSRLLKEAKNAESKVGAERMLTVHICLSLLMASLYLPMMFERLSCTYVMATMSSYFKSGIIWAPMLIYSVIFGITTAVNAKKAQKYTLVYHKLSKLCHCIFVITFALIYCLAIYISSAIFESSYGTFIRIIDIGLSWIVMTVYCSVIMLVCNIPYSIMAKYPKK